MAEISVQYVGGEQDGRREQVEVDTRPDLLYLWRATEDSRMSKAKGDARKILAEKLGVLAYKFAGMRGNEHVYARWPQADKKMTSA